MPGIEIRRFGGMAPKTPSSELNRTMAELVVDVDLSRGSLRPWRTDRLINTNGANALSFMVEECCLQAYDVCVDIAEQTLPCTRFYRTGLNGYPEASDDGCTDWCRLGFPCVNEAPTMSVLSPTVTEQKVIQRRYLYTLVDKWGNESAGSPPSNAQLADWDNKALISGFTVPGAPYCVKFIRIYSTAPIAATQQAQTPSMEEFYLVAEIPVGQTSHLHDPTATGYGSLYMNEDFDEAPAGLHDIAYWGTNQIGGLADGRLFLSKQDHVHVFPRNSVLAFHDPAVRWMPTQQYAYILTCGRPEVVDITKDCKGGRCRGTTTINESLPLYGVRSVARHGNAVVYASLNGLVMLEGSRHVVLTADFFTPDQWQALSPQLMQGVVHNGYYFATTQKGTLRFELPGNLLDRRDTDTVTFLSVNPTSWYRSRDGRLYFSDAGGIYEWNAGAQRKSMLWRSAELDIRGAPKWAAGKLEQEDGYSAEFVMRRKGRERFRRQVDGGCRGFRIPAQSNGCSLQIEISGTAEVFRAKLATSLYDLSRVTS